MKKSDSPDGAAPLPICTSTTKDESPEGLPGDEALTSFEMLGRERKVAKLIDAMDAVMRHRVTADQAAHLSLEQMTVIITLADVRPPSAATMDAVAERLMERDRDWEGCQCRHRGDVEDAGCCPVHGRKNDEY